MNDEVTLGESSTMNNIPDGDFQILIRHTPLVSVDLIITDPMGCCLLGRRQFRPAKGTMFVPGGRIYKNEPIDVAFNRVLLLETGQRICEQDEKTFMGVYEHFYDDSFQDITESTHYVVLAYRIKLRSRFNVKPDNQHDLFEWFSVNELLARPDVHKNVKAYFG